MIRRAQRFEIAFWNCMPCLITALLMLVCLVPKHIAGLSSFMPLLPILPIFYWGLIYAREMPYWFVFMAGIVMDAATGLPLGMSSLLYILFLALLHSQRKYIFKEGFIMKWGYFSLLLAVILILGWLIISFMNAQLQPLAPAFMQWLLTVGCYPLFHKGFDALYHHIANRRWQILHGG